MNAMGWGKPLAALLMMTSVPFAAPTDADEKARPQSYTLVLRDKRGITMLIRGVPALNTLGGMARETQKVWEVSCELLASGLKQSTDVESAECFE